MTNVANAWRGIVLASVLFSVLAAPAGAGVCDPRYRGDFDLDNDVDIVDHAELVDCHDGPGAGIPVGCEPKDLDTDGDIDLADAAMFYACAGTDGLTPPTACELPLQQHGIDADWDTTEYPVNVDGYFGVGRQLDIDSDNTYHAAYTSLPGNAVNWIFSTNGGMDWSTPYEVSGTNGGAGGSVAVGPGDTLHFAWFSSVGGGSRIEARSRVKLPSGSYVWTPIKDLSGVSTNGLGPPSLTVDTNERVHVAWHSGDETDPVTTGAHILYVRSVDNGNTFGTPVRLNPVMPVRPAIWPRFLARGTSGDTLAVAWRSVDTGLTDWNVDVAVSTNGGATFSVEYPANNANIDEWDPEALVDAAGNVHLAYQVGGTGDDIIYQRRSALTGTWTPPSGLAPASGVFLGWGYDPTGTLWLMWKDQRDMVNALDRRSDMISRYSTDAGVTWADAEFITDRCFTEVGFHAIAVRPDGRPVVIWLDDAAGGFTDMYVKTRGP